MSEYPQSESQNNISDPHESNDDLFVVGIGASAGGLSALEELFSNLSTATGAAFVVIQHLSPDFKSLMKELLERRTTMPVYRVTEGMELQPNSVYLIPPGQNLALEQNVLRLEDRKKDRNKKHELNFPIDLFFSSLAKNYGEQSIGVILSGSGSDGTRGLRAINEVGGVALVQDPETAEFDGMPRSAIATGVVNQVLPPRELSQLIYQCIVAPVSSLETKSGKNNLINSLYLSQIAKLLIEEEELDFSQYKASTISRRIHRRCLIHNTNSIDEYISLLNNSSQERQILCSDLLINVTHFFRDYPAWQNLENNILPRLIEQSKPDTELRFWVTACSTGEEAYSLAILVHEALQDDHKKIRVKIFATDVDRVALEKASQGIYPSSISRDIGYERLQRYFVAKDNSYQIMRKIREMLIFSFHDLTKDAGFTRINLVTCRNVLIYMKSDLQNQVLRNLHFSLVSKGVLFLGEAETLGAFDAEFEPLDKKWKFFQKTRDVRLPLPLRSTPKIRKSHLSRFSQPQSKVQFEPILEQCLNRLSDQLESIILLVGTDNNLLHVSGDCNKIFKAPNGKITTEVTKMVVLPLQLPLNTALHRAKQKGKSVLYQGIKLEYQGEMFKVDLEVLPPQSNRKHGDFFVVKIKQEVEITPLDFPETVNFELGSEASQRIIELENELQQTRENLQALVEELETTNEEQQASNEELTASNEELQSTNEELHSVNEELHTVNIEYQSKIQELTQLNNDVDNLLKSTDIGVIFLDSELRIRKFTPAATKVMSLRATDLERPLADLTLKIDCPQLPQLLESVLTQHRSITQEVQLKARDSFFLMQINPYQTEDGHNDGLALSFVEINQAKKVQLELENALAEVESKKTEINNFFQLSLEIMCVANLDGYFKRINPSFERILGYQTQELLAQPFINFVHPDDVEATTQAVQQLATGKELAGFENRYRCKDGSYRWLKWMAAAYEGAIYATAHDLTEEKLAQELQNRQLAAIEAATNGIAILNEDKFIYLNQAHLEIFGYSQPEELLGQSWRVLYEPDYLARLEREVFPVLQDKGRWHGVVKAKHRDGHLFDEELTLTFSRAGDLICVCQDISDRLTIERCLIESEKKYRYLYENTPVMLHSIDSQGRIISVSKYWLEKMGYSAEEVIGKKSTDFLTPESQQHAQEILPEFFRTGSCYNVFYQWVCKDGTIIDGLLSAISEMREDKIVRSLAVVVDITEQRQKEKLEEANRAKDRFIAHMSHELRTPLNSVLGFSNILKQDSSLNQEQLKTVDLINQSGQHLLTLINDVLDLSKLTADKLQLRYCDFNLIHLLQNTVTIFQIRAQEKGLNFVTQIPLDIPAVVNTDETRLRQVLLNLLSNAVKFTLTGTITFSVSCLTVKPNSKIKTIRFQVEDTGTGISPDQYDLVFAPFGQVDPSSNNSEGTGLGLAICQNILSLMNSKIHLSSKVGQGSRFWFDLDLEEISSTSSLLADPNFDNFVVRNLVTPRKVLVIDDNQENRLLLVQYLQPLGFTLQEADNGRSGIAIAKEFQPDVILIDFLMPVMNGKETIERIRQHSNLQDTVILMISANIQSIRDSSDIKCDGFLAKPLDLDKLLELLEQHLQFDWQISPTIPQANSSIATELNDFITPSPEKLRALLELVNFGNMKDLLQQVELLIETDSQYISFADNIRQLAENCQQDKLEQFLTTSIEQLT